MAGLAAGNYSAGVASPTGGSGLALAEVYDADAANSTARLANVSTLANAGGTNVLDAGFVISGTTDETVLIRAVGPTLGSGFAVSGALANPRLTLNDGNGNVIAINTGWTNAPTLGASTVRSAVLPATATLMTAAGAFALTANSADSALIVTLPPGSYTALVTSPTGATGLSLVEVYELR